MTLYLNKNIKKVAVGLSGGVDSSVAAYLLREQGYDVTGVYIQCWDARADGCRAEEDRADAVKVAAHLGLPFTSLDFISAYKEKVIDLFYRDYALGLTPNPDILCNKEIKFGLFLDWALKMGFDYVATGHYAQVGCDAKACSLFRGVDETKDQSYFLYRLGQEQLSRVLFPLGSLIKTEVRDIALGLGLHTAKKPDSVGICFIGEVSIRDFLAKRLAPRVGKVVSTTGEILGDHDGVWFYTIGQRHGFRLSTYVGLPLYVVGKNVDANELVVGHASEVLCSEFAVGDLSWVSGQAPELPFESLVRIRHLGELYEAEVESSEAGVGGASAALKIIVKDPIFGVAPGQSAVFYRDAQVLGGGLIL